MIFHSQHQAEHKLGKKRPVKQNNFTFHETNAFSVNVWLYIFLKYVINEIKKLHGPMAFGIHMFLQLQN